MMTWLMMTIITTATRINIIKNMMITITITITLTIITVTILLLLHPRR